MKEIEIKIIPINKIHSNVNQPRETFDKEKIEEMAKSIEKFGLLNPITVRPFNDGYQIVAGERRWKALQMMNKKEIQAKIVEADDIETDIMSIAENYHREDLTLEEREKSIYAAWKRGVESGLFVNLKKEPMYSIMSEWTGISERMLQYMINAGKEKEKSKSETVLKSTSISLQTTRSLKDISPKLRENLLQTKLDEKINRIDLESVVKTVKNAVKEGTSKEDVEKIVNKVIKETPQNEKIKPENVKNLFDTVKQLPSDLKDKVINGKINIEEAKVVMMFPTEEQRTQVLKERKKIKDETNKVIERNKRDLETHTEIRQKQAEDVSKGNNLQHYTKLDFQKMDNEERKTPEYINDRILSEYGRYLVQFCFSIDDINHMSPEGAKTAISYVRRMYDLCHTILINYGEIKIINEVNNNDK